MIRSFSKLARIGVFGLALAVLLLPSLGCEQKETPVIDTSTPTPPAGGSIPKEAQHKLKFTPKPGN